MRLIWIIILSTNVCIGQDTNTTINNEWSNLKAQLQRRSDLVVTLGLLLKNSKSVDKKQLKKCEALSKSLVKHIDTLHLLNAKSIEYASLLDKQLRQSLGRTLITVELDRQLTSNHKFQSLQVQLEGMENRIKVATHDYNYACKEANRLDLEFGINSEEPPKVIF